MAGGCRQDGAVVGLSLGTLVPTSLSLFSLCLLFARRLAMTVLQPASWHDILFMEDFLECASAAFDTIPVGVSVSTVDLMFRRWLGFAAEGRSDPDWPSNVLVSVLLVGADARPVRFHR